MRTWRLVQASDRGFVRCRFPLQLDPLLVKLKFLHFPVLGRHPPPIPATCFEDESKVEFWTCWIRSCIVIKFAKLKIQHGTKLAKWCVKVLRTKYGRGLHVREDYLYQFRWIFGKLPNGLWPPPYFRKTMLRFLQRKFLGWSDPPLFLDSDPPPFSLI